MLAADLSATVFQTFTAASDVGNSGFFVITANSSGGYPVALVGVPKSSLVNYQGGAISPASNFVFANGDHFGINGASFGFHSTNVVGPDVIGNFQAIGTMVGGGAFSGTATVDLTTGVVQAASFTAVVPQTYKLSAGIGGVPNYANTGLFVIVVNEAAGAYAIALLGLAESDLGGYAGGPIVEGSNLAFANGTGFQLLSGSLTPVPGPSTLAFLLGGGLLSFADQRFRVKKRCSRSRHSAAQTPSTTSTR